jgi:hypothetical protein
VFQGCAWREDKVLLVVGSDWLRCRSVLVSVNSSEDGLDDVSLLATVLKHIITLDETLHQSPLVALGEELGFAVQDAIVDLLASLGQTLEDDGESGDGLGEDAGLLLGA